MTRPAAAPPPRRSPSPPPRGEEVTDDAPRRAPRSRAPVPQAPRRAAPAPRPTVPWTGSLTAGLSVLLAGGPVSAVVQGTAWFGYAFAAVALVVGTALLLQRFGAALVVLGQFAGILLVLTITFADDALLGFLPGPAVFGQFGTIVTAAGRQIDTGIAPVAATPEILFLLTAAFGLLAVGVQLASVVAGAPAAAGVPLLAVFAVPAALADQLLPWWTMAGAAAGFGLLLVAAGGLRNRLPGGSALVVGAVVLALGLGAITPFVGTAGRFAGEGRADSTAGSIGLTPFTSLRGQLTQAVPTDLFEVQGLTRPAYLRALTLRQYVPDRGWQATRPAPGIKLPGPVQQLPTIPGDFVDVEITNLGFGDYWLPLYGKPIDVTGLPGTNWFYDLAAGTAYSGRPRQEDSWHQRAVLPTPSMQQLRAAQGIGGVGLEYLDTTGVDPRVGEIAQEVVGDAGPGFDRVFALQDWFAGADSEFAYSLATAPGTGGDALVEFLTVGRTGYCEQFASAMAVMLRTVGVPARVAVGFTAGTEEGGQRVITTADAHAWVEAWFPGIGWMPFDPTPLTDGRRIDPPYIQEARAEQQQLEPGAPADGAEEPAPEPLSGDGQQAPQRGAGEPAQPEAAAPPVEPAGGGVPLWPFAVALVVPAVALVPALVRRRERRRRLAAVTGGGSAAVSSGWEELLAESTDRGADSPPSDTVRAAARRLVREHRLDKDAQQALRTVVSAVEASWYGDAHPARGQLDEPVRAVAAAIAAGSPLSLRGRLLPRSVLQHRRVARAAAREREKAVTQG